MCICKHASYLKLSNYWKTVPCCYLKTNGLFTRNQLTLIPDRAVKLSEGTPRAPSLSSLLKSKHVVSLPRAPLTPLFWDQLSFAVKRTDYFPVFSILVFLGVVFLVYLIASKSKFLAGEEFGPICRPWSNYSPCERLWSCAYTYPLTILYH